MIEVCTSARVHMVLVDMNGELGRKNMSIGFKLREPCWRLRFAERSGPSVAWGSNLPSRAVELDAIFNNIQTHFSSRLANYSVQVSGGIPSHCGLGSTTALYMGLAGLLNAASDNKFSQSELASFVGRGGVSGIGCLATRNSGLLVDTGTVDSPDVFTCSRYSKASPPKLMIRLRFPTDRILYLLPDKIGLSGEKEKDFFAQHCPIPRNEIEQLTRLIFVKMLPAVVEGDMNSFVSAVDMLQNIGFKKREIDAYGGSISEVIDQIHKAGGAGVGMSSIGPGVYVLGGDFEQVRAWANDSECIKLCREYMVDNTCSLGVKNE